MEVTQERSDGEGSQFEGVAVDIQGAPNSWVMQIHSKFDIPRDQKTVASTPVVVYKVPPDMMDCKPKAYIPKVCSFGPYYHNKDKQLSAMDDYKVEAVRRTIEERNLVEEVKAMDVQRFMINAITPHIDRIRNCYEDSAKEHDDKTLAWMIAMDACFIFQFLCTSTRRDQKFSLIFKHLDNWNSKSSAIMRDILKLENQIPLFILTMILQKEGDPPQKAESILAGVLSPHEEFNGYPFSIETKQRLLKDHIHEKPFHLLDLYRRVITDLLIPIPHSDSSSTTVRLVRRIVADIRRCACYVLDLPRTEIPNSGSNIRDSYDSKMKESALPTVESLHKAGIKFKVGAVRFENRWWLGSRTLFLPQITVDDSTETCLRNLVALEECQIHGNNQKNVVSHYISLLDDLIDSQNDVTLLREAGIIVNDIGSDAEIATMFNDLCKGITVGGYLEFEKVADEVKEDCRRKAKAWISQFKEEHCSKPWYIVPIVATILILVMTCVQTVYTVKSYFKV